jgi:hypothetical protein
MDDRYKVPAFRNFILLSSSQAAAGDAFTEVAPLVSTLVLLLLLLLPQAVKYE